MIWSPLLRALPWICLATSAAARPPVIDVHVHTDPRRYALVADVLAANGVTRFVNLSGGPLGSRALTESIQQARDLPGRIAVCANIDWRGLNDPRFGARQAALLAEAAEAGAACLKVSKALGLYVPDPHRPEPGSAPQRPEDLLAVDDPRLDPIWAAAGRLKLPVMIHTGDPKAFFEPATPENERWAELGVHPSWSFADPRFPRRAALLAARDRVLARHRGTTFVGVHFANNPEDLDYVAGLLDAHPNLYVDLAARLPELGRHPAARVRALLIRHRDRVLFGTDLGVGDGIMLGSTGTVEPRLPDIDLFYHDHFRWLETGDRAIPHPTPIQGDWRIDAVALPPEVLAAIYSGNALKLFWKTEAPDEVDEAALWLAPGYAELQMD